MPDHHNEDIKKLYANYDKQKEFISIAAHELRSPIVPILGTLELMEYEFEESGKNEITLKKEHFDMIARNARRLERLASEILDVSKINEQVLTLTKEYFNLSEVVLDAIEDFRQQIKQSNSKLKLIHEFKNKQEENVSSATDQKDMFVYADKGRITQVIYNLLSNAIKFTTEGIVSFLILSNSKNDVEEAVLSVRDTGTGIDPDILPRLFSIFATRSDTGTGLGLFISKNMVEAHGGTIWGENNPDGKGATFSFNLPLARA